MIALTPWVVALVTISIWPATLFSGVGPRNCSVRRVLQLLLPLPRRPGAPGRTAGCRGTSAAAPCSSALPGVDRRLARRRRGGSATAAPAPAAARQIFLHVSLPFHLVADVLRHVRDQHRQDQQGPDHARLGVAGDVGKTHAVAEVQDDEDRKADPDQIARAAEDADAAQQHDGDDVELEALRHVAAHRAEPGGVEQPGERRDRRRRRRTAPS